MHSPPLLNSKEFVSSFKSRARQKKVPLFVKQPIFGEWTYLTVRTVSRSVTWRCILLTRDLHFSVISWVDSKVMMAGSCVEQETVKFFDATLGGM